MKYLIALFSSTILGSITAKILLALGFSILTFLGTELVLNTALDYVKDYIEGLPQMVLHILGMCNFDIAINLFFSAWSFRIAISSPSKFVMSGS